MTKLEYQRKWRKNNPDKAKEIQDICKRNTTELRSQYYKDRRDKYNAYMIEYRKNNLERCKAIQKKYRENKKSNDILK